jgi:predicted CopG family antitoxin|tara:strand:+ start:1285 stop:1500 length:216 start_codon:yes stop_codon:yes gene_type:complete
MTSINISLKKEAYDFLKNLKSRDKSFSDVILSFKKETADPLEFFGKLKDVDWDGREKRMENFRDSFNRKLR